MIDLNPLPDGLDKRYHFKPMRKNSPVYIGLLVLIGLLMVNLGCELVQIATDESKRQQRFHRIENTSGTTPATAETM